MRGSFYKTYFEVEKKHWLMVVRRMVVEDSLKAYSEKKPDKMKVLDFGCGSGILVDELSRKGYQSYGLDISEEAIKFGNLQGIKNLGIIDSHKIDFPDNTFDAVVTLDVLEHLEDEEWALNEISRVLKPGGTAVVMVPAYMFLWGVQDEVAHHYRRYTKGSLLEKIKKTPGLKVLRSSYFNTFLFLPIAFVRIISRVLGIKGRESDFDINSPLMNKFFFSIFNTERNILKHINFPVGVSVLAVFKKSEK